MQIKLGDKYVNTLFKCCRISRIHKISGAYRIGFKKTADTFSISTEDFIFLAKVDYTRKNAQENIPDPRAKTFFSLLGLPSMRFASAVAKQEFNLSVCDEIFERYQQGQAEELKKLTAPGQKEARLKRSLKSVLYSGGRCGAYPDNSIYAYTINGFPTNIQEFHPNKLVFMFHGFSGNSLDFLNWTRPREENVLYVAPQGGGRTTCPKEGFTLEEVYLKEILKAIICRDYEPIRQATAKARPLLFKFLNDIRQQFNVPWDNVFVTGFSLGAILAYDVITHHEHLKYAAIASGAIDPNLNIPQPGKTILSVYSPEDRIVHGEESKRSEEQYKGLNGKVKSRLVTGGHNEAGERAYQSGIIWDFIGSPETFQ